MSSFSRTLMGTVAVAVLALSVGCDKPKEESDNSTSTEPATNPPAAKMTIELTDDDVPVAEDFIEEATKEIDEDNLNAKLDEIEKDIESE